jgi:hypothetical protein
LTLEQLGTDPHTSTCSNCSLIDVVDWEIVLRESGALEARDELRSAW